MFLYQIIILALIQGMTEFLPVSSSGHLIIVPHFLGWADQGLAMDVAVHLGTLGAVVVYFWRDIRVMLKGLPALSKRKPHEGNWLITNLIVATIPAVIIGAILGYYNPPLLRTCGFIGATTLCFGVLLGAIDWLKPQLYTLKTLTPFKSLLIGLAQALALMPGTSRSGICITMGRWLGLSRTEAAHFAFLLSIPTIIGAGVHTGVKLHLKGLSFLNQTTFLAMIFSFLFGLLAIYLMMRWLKRGSFMPFVVYRILLGFLLMAVAYHG